MRKGSSLMSLDPCSPGNPSLPGATEVPGREDDLWAAVRKAAADAREMHTSRDRGDHAATEEGHLAAPGGQARWRVKELGAG